MAWYNTYRPSQFSDVLGQDLVKTVLQNAVQTGRIKHAYLLSGPKGVGKTTIARIFANELNQLDKHPEARIDIVEMDAASNTSIEDVRQLIESAKLPPLTGTYKIYIIDEVHMLSKAAMNALLKILEEPPTYLIFLLATTNPEKLLPTVLSRLTKLNLTSHSPSQLLQKLTEISTLEKLNIDVEALRLIAKRAQGSQRDSINLLETIAGYNLPSYDENTTARLLGLLPDTLLEQITQALASNDLSTDILTAIENSGIEGELLTSQLLEYVLDVQLGRKQASGEYSRLIIPIAEILDLRLPITSAVGYIALIQAKLGQLGFSKLVSKIAAKPTNEPKPIAKSEISVKNSADSQNSTELSEPARFSEDQPLDNSFIDSTENSNNNQAKQEIQPTTPFSDVQTESSENQSIKNMLSPQDLYREMQNLLFQKDAPSILKMLLSDIDVSEISQSSAKLTVSNGIFLAQLSSPKLLEWLKVNLAKNIGANLDLTVSIRSGAKQNVQTPTPSTQNQVTPSKLAEPAQNYNQNVKSTTHSHDSKIFYSVYGTLPPEIKDSGIPVITGPLKGPQDHKSEIDTQTKTNHSENSTQNQTLITPTEPNHDWDDHASSMFEFED